MPVYGQSSAEQELKRLEAERQRREERVGALVDDANRVASDAEALRRKLVAAAEARVQARERHSRRPARGIVRADTDGHERKIVC